MDGRKTTLAASCMQVEHDKAKNLEKYARFIEEAASKGADFLAFPEASLQGYTWVFDRQTYRFVDDPEVREYFQREAEPVPGPSTSLIQTHCKKHDMYIQVGMAEKAKDGKGLYNSAVLIGSEGVVGVHRKVYMAPNPTFMLGDRFSVFETRLGKFGALVCQDLITPESTTTLAVQGAEVAVLSTAWGMRSVDPKTDYMGYTYDLLTRANALVNQVWLVSSNQIGASSKVRALGRKGGCYGHSRIVAPTGKIVAEVGFEEGLAVATVDIKGGIEEARSPSFHGLNYREYRYPECHKPLFQTKT